MTKPEINTALEDDDNNIEVKGIIFDMDGTLCLPQTWMFKEMRDSIGLKDKNIDILKFIDMLSEEEQILAKERISLVEQKAMQQIEPQPGLVELMEYLTSIKLPKAICTRNLIIPVNHLIKKFIPKVQFDPIITRTFLPPKPRPEPILHIAKTWNIDPKNLVMVGDSIDDMKAGNSAGATTILIKTPANVFIRENPTVDYTIDSLDDIIDLLQKGLTKRS